MIGSRKPSVGIVLGFAAGGILGLAGGGYTGLRLGASCILNEALSGDAREAESLIAILRLLRTGDQKAAVEKLETGLSDILITFDPNEPFPGVTRQTSASLRKAIGEAKAYRAAYPRKKDFRDDMVESIFARDLYK